jgi:hypothetical protein
MRSSFVLIAVVTGWAMIGQVTYSQDIKLPMPDKQVVGKMLADMYHANGDGAKNYDSASVCPLKDQPFLKHNLLEVETPSGSGEVFAFDGSQFLCMDGHEGKHNFSRILKSEQTQLQAVSPMTLAYSFIETFLHSGSQVEAIVAKDADLLDFEKGGYEVDRTQLQACSDHLVTPSIFGDCETGWSVHFTTVKGVMQDLREVTAYGVEVSPQYEMSVKKRILSPKIFSRVPNSLNK